MSIFNCCVIAFCTNAIRTLALYTVPAAFFFLYTVKPLAAEDSLGRPLTPEEVTQLSSHIFPDGQGLPSGQGSVAAGEALYSKHCAACHGSAGEGASSVELIGDRELLTTEYPDKGIAVVWPFAPTLFEYINRAMPPDSPGAFNAQELYSIVGYVLYLNRLLAEDASVDKTVLSQLVMPNRNGFIDVSKTE